MLAKIFLKSLGKVPILVFVNGLSNTVKRAFDIIERDSNLSSTIRTHINLTVWRIEKS